MKTIVFYIATLTRGGAERVMVNLANYFVKQDYRVLILTLEPDEGLYEIDTKVEHRVLTMPEDGGRISNAFGRITQVRRVLKEVQADALVSFIGKTNLRAILAGLFTRTKVFVSVRSAPGREYGSGLQRLLARTLFCLADGCIFQTEEARDFFGEAVRKKSRIFYNALSGQCIDKRYTGVRKPEIVTAGRMDQVKNHALLVDAFSLMVKKHPELTLTIYGDGDCMAAVKEQAARLRLTDRINLKGDCRDVPEQMKDAGVFVLSSDFEGMPNAVAEAMALGIPVVSTDCPSGGARALVHDGETGLLVPVRDPERMAAAVLRILDDEALARKLSDNGYAFSLTLHPDRIHGQWQNYIEEVCGLGV